MNETLSKNKRLLFNYRSYLISALMITSIPLISIVVILFNYNNIVPIILGIISALLIDIFIVNFNRYSTVFILIFRHYQAFLTLLNFRKIILEAIEIVILFLAYTSLLFICIFINFNSSPLAWIFPIKNDYPIEIINNLPTNSNQNTDISIISFASDIAIATNLPIETVVRLITDTNISIIISHHELNIETKDNNLVNFTVTEKYEMNVMYKKKILFLNHQIKKEKSFSRNIEINTRKAGFLIKEIYIEPSLINNCSFVFEDTLIPLAIEDGCTPLVIKLINFPKYSFYQTQNTEEKITTSAYLNTETIIWSVKNLDDGIRIAYFSYPYNKIRNILQHLVYFASLNKWIIFGHVIIVILFFKQNLRLATITISSKATAYNYNSKSETYNNDIRGANVMNVTNKTQDNASTQANVYITEHKQSLTEVTAEIQRLLKKLEATNPTTNEIERIGIIAQAAEEIKKNSTLKAGVIGVFKAGESEAFKQGIDHPLVNILLAIIERWVKTE